MFSAASLWEVAIKRGLGRDDFQVDPRLLRRGLRDNGYSELAITSEHAIAIDLLPPIHQDPFDRILVAQSTVEGITLLTTDQWWRDTKGRCGWFEDVVSRFWVDPARLDLCRWRSTTLSFRAPDPRRSSPLLAPGFPVARE
jgi:PIN domain nuclease of toxin-antitoxin system